MQYRQLGQTGIEVSALSLGTMTFGEQNTEGDAHRQLDRETKLALLAVQWPLTGMLDWD